jgi:hypothetical protein
MRSFPFPSFPGLSQESLFEEEVRRSGLSRHSRTPVRPVGPSSGGNVRAPLGGFGWAERSREERGDDSSSDDDDTESSRSATLTSRSEGSASPEPPSSRPLCGVERGQSGPEDGLEEVDEEEWGGGR